MKISGDTMALPSSTRALTTAGFAALLASACCVLPLALALVGISGAWISRLRWLEPYSTALIVLAVAALGIAAWRIFRPAADGACNADGSRCRSVSVTARRWFWLVALITLIPLLVPLAAPWFY